MAAPRSNNPVLPDAYLLLSANGSLLSERIHFPPSFIVVLHGGKNTCHPPRKRLVHGTQNETAITLRLFQTKDMPRRRRRPLKLINVDFPRSFAEGQKADHGRARSFVTPSLKFLHFLKV